MQSVSMYKTPEQFLFPNEVADYRKYCDSVGLICDLNGWYVSVEKAAKFRVHLNKMLPMAEAGNPHAQYSVACIYMLGQIYDQEENYIKNYESDANQMSYWLEKAARQGFVIAVDNLVVVGKGEEADRLRAIAQDVKRDHPDFEKTSPEDKTMSVILPSFFEKVWEIAYGNGQSTLSH